MRYSSHKSDYDFALLGLEGQCDPTEFEKLYSIFADPLQTTRISIKYQNKICIFIMLKVNYALTYEHKQVHILPHCLV